MTAGPDRLWALIRQLQGALGGNRLIAGSVSSAGTILAGAGFSVSKTSTGEYTVVFDTPFAAVPVITYGLGTTASRVGVKHKDGTSPTVNGFVAWTFSSSALADGAFDFHAIGTST